MKKCIVPVLCMLLLLAMLLQSCSQDKEAEYFATQDAKPTVDLDESRDLTGTVTGSASAVYTLSTGTVTCTDEAAQYTMLLAKDGTPPQGSLLTEKAGKGEYYFRLDVLGVMRILDKGKCIQRDPSDDRVAMKIEGYYTGSTYKFTAFTCGKEAALANTEIYYTSDYVVKGTIECIYSDQMKYTYQFSDLKLR